MGYWTNAFVRGFSNLMGVTSISGPSSVYFEK